MTINARPRIADRLLTRVHNNLQVPKKKGTWLKHEPRPMQCTANINASKQSSHPLLRKMNQNSYFLARQDKLRVKVIDPKKVATTSSLLWWPIFGRFQGNCDFVPKWKLVGEFVGLDVW